MSKSTNEPVSRDELRELLRRWQAALIDEKAVHETAEAWTDRYPEKLPTYPHTDPRSIADEVLSQLEILDAQLITPEDVPALLAFLETPTGQEQAGWNRYQRYWDGVDFNQRIRELADIPYYSKSTPPTR